MASMGRWENADVAPYRVGCTSAINAGYPRSESSALVKCHRCIVCPSRCAWRSSCTAASRSPSAPMMAARQKVLEPKSHGRSSAPST